MPIEYGEEVPRTVTRTAPPLDAATRRSRPRFILMVHPARWTWDPVEKDWLPELGRILLDPGLHGVGGDLKNIDDTKARAYWGKKGWVLIEDGDPRLKPVLNKGEYLARHLCVGGWAYTFRWEGPERVGTDVEWGEDRNLRVRVQRHLVSSGIVPPMPEAIKRVELRKVRKRVRSTEEKAERSPHLASLAVRASEARQRLADMEAAAGIRAADLPLDVEVGAMGAVEVDEDPPEHIEVWSDPVGEVASAAEPAPAKRSRKG